MPLTEVDIAALATVSDRTVLPRALKKLRDELAPNVAALELRTVTDLLAVDSTKLPRGTVARTSSPRAEWLLVLASGATPVEGLVLDAGANNNRWVRMLGGDPLYRRQGTFYVSSTGAWTAAGTNQNEPTTIDEVLRRLDYRVDGPTTVHVLDTIEQDFYFHVDGPPAPTAWFELSGVNGRTILAEGTVSAYTAPEPGVSRGELTASFSLAAHVGKKGRVTGGDLAGAEFWVIKSTSGGKAEISVPQLTPYWGDAVALAPGDPIVIEEIPSLDGLVVGSGSAMLNFDNLHLGSPGAHTISITSEVMLASSCSIASMDIGASPFGGSQLLNCYVENACRVYGGGGLVMFLGAVKAGAALRARERGQLDFDQTISYARLLVHAQAVVRVYSWLGVFDSAVAVRIHPGGVLDVSFEDGGGARVWGEGISAAGGSGRVIVEARGAFIYDAATAPIVNGSGTEYLIGGEAKAFADLPYTAANGAAVVTN